METVWQICAGFALACAAGLNAYIPLVVVAIMVSGGVGELSVRAGWEMIGNRAAVLVLMGLLLVEMVVDKVAAWNRLNDRIQRVVRPAAGGILFALTVAKGSAILWLGLGVACAMVVHALKVRGRRAVNLQSGRVGTPVVSVVEDLVAMVVTMVSLLVPVLGVVMVGVFGWILWKAHGKFFGRRRRVHKRVGEAKGISVQANSAP